VKLICQVGLHLEVAQASTSAKKGSLAYHTPDCVIQSGGIFSLLTPGFEASWASELVPHEAGPKARAEWFGLHQFNSPV